MICHRLVPAWLIRADQNRKGKPWRLVAKAEGTQGGGEFEGGGLGNEIPRDQWASSEGC